MANERIVTAVGEVSRMVNTFGNPSPEFNELMSREHRTLQNSFTRLCLSWIEFVASDEYRHDPRNESGHNVCKDLMKLFREKAEKEGWTGSSLELMAKPSGYCACV